MASGFSAVFMEDPLVKSGGDEIEDETRELQDVDTACADRTAPGFSTVAKRERA